MKILPSKAFDVFRPPGYQRPVESGSSGNSRQYLLNGVNQGITGDFLEEWNKITPQIHIRKELIRLALTDLLEFQETAHVKNYVADTSTKYTWNIFSNMKVALPF